MSQTRYESAVALIEAGKSQRAAAKAVGVPESTLRGWLTNRGPSDIPSDGYIEIPVIHRDYSRQEKLYVYPLGDVHKGAPAHDSARWQEWLDYLVARPGTSLVGTGDFLNSALKTSVSEAYDETQTVGVAKRDLREQLRPLRKRIDLLMPGNHEDRIYRAIGDCPIQDVSEFLDVPYARTAALVVYHVGDVEYTVYVRHGTGAGQVGARAARLQRQAQTIIADCYVSGHTHQSLTFPEEIFAYNPASQTIERRRRYFVSSGSFIRYEGYAANAAFPPTKLGAPRIRFDGRRHDIHVSI